MIELKDVSFTYSKGKKNSGVKDINLTINKGETILLCGESGCGKTTLTRLINGLIPSYYEGELEGDVLYSGKKLNEMPMYEIAKYVGSVFQNPRSQFFNVDTTSEISFGCENMGLPEKDIRDRVLKTVDDFKIKSLENKSIFKISGGEKQKVACASVSACYSQIFVLDEPSSNLDSKAINDLKIMIKNWKEEGKTIIIAEHRLYYLMNIADRILYMKDGCIDCEICSEQMKKIDTSELNDMGLRTFSLDKLKASDAGAKSDSKHIRFKDFLFSYDREKYAMKIEDLTIPWNSVVAVTGLNGAGKSTFARCLCGLEKKCKGTVDIHEEKIKHRHRLKRSYMVMQDVNHQLFTESVLDEVLLSMDEPDEKKAEDILSSLNINHEKDLHPMSLSGGQKQRVAIASAIASDKDIIIFDEPTSGLDLRHMRDVAENIKGLSKEGKMIFVISHDLELILACCTFVVHLEDGKVKDNFIIENRNTDRLFECFCGRGGLNK